MELGELVILLSRLGMGALGTFFAILLWSQTRDVSWVLVIIGTLVAYAEIVLSTLERFGILSPTYFEVSGFPLLRVLLVNLPMFLYTLGFITRIARRRR
ncbi:MAG: hypothetical protein JW820_03580 [Spirochaetales bacterium]|nr:hypothetical protein [Spirochaetales bacterium]